MNSNSPLDPDVRLTPIKEAALALRISQREIRKLIRQFGVKTSEVGRTKAMPTETVELWKELFTIAELQSE